jgi:hypothetical protein
MFQKKNEILINHYFQQVNMYPRAPCLTKYMHDNGKCVITNESGLTMACQHVMSDVFSRRALPTSSKRVTVSFLSLPVPMYKTALVGNSIYS